METKKTVVIPASLIDDYAEAKALHDAFKPTEALYVKLGDELKALVKDCAATDTFTESGARFSLDISAQAFESVVNKKAARKKLGAADFFEAVSLTLKSLGNFLTKPEVDALVTKRQSGARKYVTAALSLLFLFVAVPAFAQSGPAGCPVSQHCAALTWVDTLNPAGTTYNVWRSAGACPASQPTSTSGFTQLNSSPVTIQAYTDSTVAGGSTYCYVVTAVNGSSQSGPSNDAQGAIPGEFPAAAVTVTTQ